MSTKYRTWCHSERLTNHSPVPNLQDPIKRTDANCSADRANRCLASGVQNTAREGAARAAFDATGRYWVLLLVIVVVGTLLRLYHFRVTIGCDDQAYLIASRSLGEAPYPGVSPYIYTRILWTSVLAAWGAVAGSSLQSSAILMLLLGACTTCMVAEFARRAFGAAAGLLAALFYATQPLNVLFDVLTLPHNLAVFVLASALVLFLEYVRKGSLAFLVPATFLVGLLFSVKDYYVVAAVPFGLTILSRATGWRDRLRHAAFFSACCAAGIGVDFLLNLVISGDAWAHLVASSSYPERRLDGTWQPLPDHAVRIFHTLFWERTRYFTWLFDEYAGIVTGAVTLWGALFLCSKSRGCLVCRHLILCVAVFLAFLMLMPTSFRPLVLVEMQPRYLTVLLPMLCIGAGAAAAGAWSSLTSTTIRNCGAAALLLAIGYNVVVPNNLIDHHRVQEFRGIRDVLKGAAESGLRELLLPAPYDVFLADSFYDYGVKFTYREAADEAAVRSIPEYLQNDPSRGVLLPERPYPKTDAFLELKRTLSERAFHIEEIRVPRSTYRAWLRWMDIIDADDQVVGWVARAKSEAGNGRSAPARTAVEK